MNSAKTPKSKADAPRKREKIICTIGYLIVPLFFILLYCLMFMAYEDLYQAYSEADSSIPGIINKIYHYIPRTGELYQHIAIHFMTISVSLGGDLFFRLLIAGMASALIYFSTFFALKKRPELTYQHLIIYLGLFLILMLFETSEVFTFGFSYIHNYVIAGLTTVTFLLPFRLKTHTSSFWKIAGMIILGILCAMSNEIAPLAILVTLFGWFIVKLIRKTFHIKYFWQNYKLQTFGVIGLLIGLIIFYNGAGLAGRTGGAYAEWYDYVSVFDIFKGSVRSTIYQLWQHAWFNMRYLMFTPFLLLSFILIESLIAKPKRIKKTNLNLYLTTLFFCALYLGASCQIEISDALYPRYLFLVYLAIFISSFCFLNFILTNLHPSKKSICRSSIILIIITILASIDMVFAFTVYRIQLGNEINKVIRNDQGTIEVLELNAQTNMIPSPFFKLSQNSPYSWGDIDATHMKYGSGPKIEDL